MPSATGCCRSPILLVAINPLLGGFDSGWTAYPPLSQQANLGQQAYLMAFVTVGVSRS